MTKQRVLCVDDEPVNLLVLEDLLQDEFEVLTASNGQQALELLHSDRRIMITLLDIVMPEMNGFELCQKVKSDPLLCDIPVLFISSLSAGEDEAHGLAVGAEDFIHKPFQPPVVKARVRTHLQFAAARRELRLRNDSLEALVAERTYAIIHKTEQVMAAQSATISAFCSLAEARDNETGNHIRRTQHYVRAVAEALRHHPRFRDELDEQTIELFFRTAPLHDIGKVAIPDAILNKPSKFTPDEWEIMKRHAEYGRNAIAAAERDLTGTGLDFLRYAREIAHSHHEKWDGSGYPQGLKGESIPLGARLMAVADVFDALISRRAYKPPFTHEQALAVIAEGRGSHFDPDIADAVLRISEQFREIARTFSDTALS